MNEGDEELSKKIDLKAKRELGQEDIKREFDPGSGRTLAACLTHASRTKLVFRN